jgi:hypothetical protein
MVSGRRSVTCKLSASLLAALCFVAKHPTPPPTLRYTPRFQRIANNLRGRLDKLGLTDVGVKLEGLLDRQGSIEGVYSPENRVIRLASALHDSNLSDTQLEAQTV